MKLCEYTMRGALKFCTFPTACCLMSACLHSLRFLSPAHAPCPWRPASPSPAVFSTRLRALEGSGGLTHLCTGVVLPHRRGSALPRSLSRLHWSAVKEQPRMCGLLVILPREEHVMLKCSFQVKYASYFVLCSVIE